MAANTKKALIVFHSICGSTYLMAQAYAKAFGEQGVEASLFRAPDPAYEGIAAAYPAAADYAAQILQVPAIEGVGGLPGYDFILLGSPVYFGNMSAPIKRFIDQFSDFWPDALLFGKRFGAFVTSGTAQGGADICLQTLNVFALHMGMIPVPAAANLRGAVQPAYGIAHYSGDNSDCRPSREELLAIEDYVERMVRV